MQLVISLFKPDYLARRRRALRPLFWLSGALLGLLAGACAREPYGPPNARPPEPAGRPLPPSPDSVRGMSAGRHYNRCGRLYRAVFGAHYRSVWAAPVTAPVLDLAHAAPGGGPLQFDKAGGGFQSISLSLRAPDGREFALRALDKDPRKTLPGVLRKTFLLNAVRDATSAINPYAALVVPPLAEAAGVIPTHPRLVYVQPDEAGLGKLSGRLRGQLALLEEKYSGPANQPAALAGARELLDSEPMLARVYADPRQRLDQAALLRARLLDVWLGDWDRHSGQWQWAAFRGKDGRTRFQALPKDRDQVFFRFDDGALPWLVSRLVPKFQTFRARYGSVPGLVRQARFIDERGLVGASRADFQRAASLLQARLPDSLLARALHRLPPAVYGLVGPGTAAALRARRAALPAAAEQFYRRLARRPVVGGTAQAERFVVRRTADSVTVSVFSAGLGADSLLFRRTFLPGETRQLTLEGLAGDDVFDIETAAAARPASRVRLRLVGGAGTDRVRGAGPARRLVFYDDQPATGPSERVAPRPLPRRYPRYDRLSDN
ncbi:hypothetical protein [uncultured Hymenobacter sp.]|uniref:hypothetical protein n=1 Tax=uncultured Hymenobacter sp. TaxID=170016 RepID=UPI0035C957BC